MNVFEALFKRKRAESFREEEIEDRYIGVILHAATFAPSAGNLKPWEFIVVKDGKKKREIKKFALHEKKIEEASYLIIICIDMEKLRLKYGEKSKKYAEQDAASVITYMMVAAKGLGLDSDWIRNFDAEKISQLLKLPENLKVKGIVVVGKARDFQEEFELSFENVTHVEEYGKKFAKLD